MTKEVLETKNAVVAAVPANSTFLLFGAVIAGNPTAAQVEAARNTLAASLELVGATATSAYLTRFEPVELNVDADEGLLLDVAASLSKIAPDPLPEIGDETPPEESASSESVPPLDGAATENGATSNDAAAIDAPEAPEA